MYVSLDIRLYGVFVQIHSRDYILFWFRWCTCPRTLCLFVCLSLGFRKYSIIRFPAVHFDSPSGFGLCSLTLERSWFGKLYSTESLVGIYMEGREMIIIIQCTKEVVPHAACIPLVRTKLGCEARRMNQLKWVGHSINNSYERLHLSFVSGRSPYRNPGMPGRATRFSHPHPCRHYLAQTIHNMTTHRTNSSMSWRWSLFFSWYGHVRRGVHAMRVVEWNESYLRVWVSWTLWWIQRLRAN